MLRIISRVYHQAWWVHEQSLQHGWCSDDDRIVSHDAFFQKHDAISPSWQIPSWNKVVFRRLFSDLCFSKSKKIALFCYLTWFLRFAMAWERSFHIETFIFIVSLSPHITKCSVTHNKVMNIHDFLDHVLKSSKFGSHASKMKSWILYRLRSIQKNPHFGDFFVEQDVWNFVSLVTFQRHV